MANPTKQLNRPAREINEILDKVIDIDKDVDKVKHTLDDVNPFTQEESPLIVGCEVQADGSYLSHDISLEAGDKLVLMSGDKVIDSIGNVVFVASAGDLEYEIPSADDYKVQSQFADDSYLSLGLIKTECKYYTKPEADEKFKNISISISWLDFRLAFYESDRMMPDGFCVRITEQFTIDNITYPYGSLAYFLDGNWVFLKNGEVPDANLSSKLSALEAKLKQEQDQRKQDIDAINSSISSGVGTTEAAVLPVMTGNETSTTDTVSAHGVAQFVKQETSKFDEQLNGAKKEVWSDVALTNHRYYNLNIQVGASVPAAGGTSSTNIACAKITINKGDAIKINTAIGSSAARHFAICKDGIVVAISGYSAPVEDGIISLDNDGNVYFERCAISKGEITQQYDSIDVLVNLNSYYDVDAGTYYVKTRSYEYGEGLEARVKALEEKPADVVDSLDSDDKNKALSAKQGKVLNEKIDDNSVIKADKKGVISNYIRSLSIDDDGKIIEESTSFYVDYFKVSKNDIISFNIELSYKQRVIRIAVFNEKPVLGAKGDNLVIHTIPDYGTLSTEYQVMSDGYLAIGHYQLITNTGYYKTFDIKRQSVSFIKDIVKDFSGANNEGSYLWSRLKSGVLHNCGSYGLFEDNTKETFESVKLFGEIGKVDVRITADDDIVCCHDAGIRILANGTYTNSYYGGAEKEGSTVYDIRSITKDVFCSYQWGRIISSLEQPNLPYLTDFESMLRIFKRDGIIPFITIRDTYTQETVDKVAWYLNKYNMMDSVIFNVYPTSINTLDIIKKKMPNAVCAYTLLSGAKVTKAIVDALSAYKYVYYRIWDTTSDNSMFDSCLDVIEYGQQKGVTFHAIGNTPTDVALKYGAINVGARGWGDFKKFSVMLNLSVSGNEVDSTGSIAIGYGDKKKAYICDAARVGNEIHISNIKRYYDSNEDLPAITPHWIKFFPISVKASGCGITSTSVDKDNFKFVLSANDGITDGTLLVSITVGEL